MSLIIFLLVLVLLILVHEFGHFIVAKKSGIRVDEFGIGFPPKLWGRKKGETEYTINALPIGGFVKIYGENYEDAPPGAQDPDRDRSFVAKSKWVQAAVLVAGVAMNVLLAWVLLVGTHASGMPMLLEEGSTASAKNVRLIVTEILPGSPADKAGLKPSDVIASIEVKDSGSDALSNDALVPSRVSEYIGGRAGTPLEMRVVRRGEEVPVVVTPEAGVIASEPERAAAGFSMALSGTVSEPLHRAIVEGTESTFIMLYRITVGLGEFFYRAFTFNADFSQVAGPVGIVGLVGDASSLGFANLVLFTAMISLNLAVINLLPFPALDGGRLLFVIIEAIKRSPIKPSVANTLNTVGFAILMLLMLAVTISDVVKIIQ